MAKPEAESYNRRFGEIVIKDVPLVGGKGASLTALAKNRKLDICGQAPSDYPEFGQFLVEQKIDSI